jgi:two-component sensor histidine kinase
MPGEIQHGATGQDDQGRFDFIAAEGVGAESRQPLGEAADESTQGLQMARTADAALDECVTLRSLLDMTSGLIAVVGGQNHVFQFANSAWLTLVGSDVIGRSVRDVLPQPEVRGMLTLLDSIQARGHAGRYGQRHTIAVVPAGQVLPVHLDFVCRPMAGLYGVLHGIVLEGSDVTDRVLAGERQKLLTNELAHRVKNTSATVLGLARLARGSTTDIDAFLASLTDRIVAMCRTQDLLTVGRSQFIPVKNLLSLELEPYLDRGGDWLVEVACQDLTLAAASAVSLAMIVHELLTNALKYGALSAAGGRLQISCEAVGQRALLTWSETTLHPVGPIEKRGFGSRLIERLAQSLGGRLRFESRPDGLDVAMTFMVEAAATRP